MNDFTKEELQIMLLDMNAYIYRTSMLVESPDHLALRDKLELMIGNYCEHEYTGEVEIFVDVCCHCDALLVRHKTLREINE